MWVLATNVHSNNSDESVQTHSLVKGFHSSKTGTKISIFYGDLDKLVLFSLQNIIIVCNYSVPLLRCHLMTTHIVPLSYGRSGLEVIKLEFSLRLKIKRNDWLLRARVRKQPIIALYFELETVLKFYNLEACSYN